MVLAAFSLYWISFRYCTQSRVIDLFTRITTRLGIGTVKRSVWYIEWCCPSPKNEERSLGQNRIIYRYKWSPSQMMNRYFPSPSWSFTFPVLSVGAWFLFLFVFRLNHVSLPSLLASSVFPSVGETWFLPLLHISVSKRCTHFSILCSHSFNVHGINSLRLIIQNRIQSSAAPVTDFQRVGQEIKYLKSCIKDTDLKKLALVRIYMLPAHIHFWQQSSSFFPVLHPQSDIFFCLSPSSIHQLVVFNRSIVYLSTYPSISMHQRSDLIIDRFWKSIWSLIYMGIQS